MPILNRVVPAAPIAGTPFCDSHLIVRLLSQRDDVVLGNIEWFLCAVGGIDCKTTKLAFTLNNTFIIWKTLTRVIRQNYYKNN
jgi:hypothetical protein